MTPWVQALVPESSTHNHEPLREAAPPPKKKKKRVTAGVKGTLWLTPVTLTIGKQKQEDD